MANNVTNNRTNVTEQVDDWLLDTEVHPPEMHYVLAVLVGLIACGAVAGNALIIWLYNKSVKYDLLKCRPTP